MGTEFLTIEQRAGYTWVILPFSITLDNYREIKREIDSRIPVSEHARIVLDFNRLTHIYSTGIGMIVQLGSRICKAHGEMCLVNVSHKIRSLFETLRLGNLFPVYSSEAEFHESHREIKLKDFSRNYFDFVFFSREENGLCRINLSGQMVSLQDLSPLDEFSCSSGLSAYVFDLSGLEKIDGYGIRKFSALLKDIHKRGHDVIVYGENDPIERFLKNLPELSFVRFYKNEHDALEGL